MAKNDPNPSKPSTEVAMLQPAIHRAVTLLGGTDAMRDAGGMYMPQHAEETHENYNDRLQSNVLHNMFDITAKTLTGRPFSEPVILKDDVPDQIADLEDDIDLCGNGITTVCRDWFQEGLTKLHGYLLVEFPSKNTVDEEGNPITRTLADDEKEGMRPYWKLYRTEDVIAVYYEFINGKKRYTHVRVDDSFIERQGFEEVYVKQIRVMEPGKIELWRVKDNKGQEEKWELHDTFETDFDEIPLVDFKAGSGDKPPLDDLAHLNIRHWQSNSDQINILTVARFPMLAASGMTERTQNEMKVGPRQFLSMREPNGKYYYVEHNGSAIKEGWNDLEYLEKTMASYGAEFLKNRPGNSTATERALDSAEATSELLDYVVRFEDAVQTALKYTAKFWNLDDGGSVRINKDVSMSAEQARQMDALNMARDNGDISHESYIDELIRLGVLSTDFDRDQNSRRIEAERRRREREENQEEENDENAMQ